MKKSYKISILLALSIIFSSFFSVFPGIKAEAQSSDATKYYYLELGSSDGGIDPDPDHLDCSVYFADGSVWNVFDVWSGPPNYFGPYESKSYVSTYFCNDYSPQRTQNVESGYSKPHSENVVSCPSKFGNPGSCGQAKANTTGNNGDFGNPIGHLETVSCSVISGWSYDPDAESPVVEPPTTTPPSNTDKYHYLVLPPNNITTILQDGTPNGYNNYNGSLPPKLSCEVMFSDGSQWVTEDVYSGTGSPSFFGPYKTSATPDFHSCVALSDGGIHSSSYTNEQVLTCDNPSTYPYEPSTYSDLCGDGNISVSLIPKITDILSSKVNTYGYNNIGDRNSFDLRGIIESIVAIFKPLTVSAKSSDSNSVQIFDGPKESGILLAVVGASQPRPDVNQVMSVSGNHGFSWSPSESLKDGNTHNIYAYGTNIESPGETTLLSGAPKSLKCEPNVTNTPPSAPTLSCPDDGSLTGENLSVSFSSTDADGNNVRYLVDWDANDTTDGLVPSNGTYVVQNTVQSSSKTWSSPGLKTVKVRAQVDQGEMSSPSSCSFTLNSPNDTSTPGTSDNPGNSGGGNGGGGSGNNPGNTNAPNNSGFTVNGTSKLAIQFLGDLPATSQTGNTSVNPVGGFSDPVTVSVQSIRSVGGADYTAGVPVYYLGGEERISVTMTYDASRGFYVNQNGLIGLTFAVKLPVKITEKHYVTIVARSGAKSASYVIELNPSNKAPQFKEI